MESMIIRNCPFCEHPAQIARDWSEKFYIWTDCNHSASGPSCDNEADAIRYWNAMMCGLKSELTK